jgi:hypothetical protein
MDTLSALAPSPDEATASRERRLAAARLQEIECNPLDAADVAMFEREEWSHERRRAYMRIAKAAIRSSSTGSSKPGGRTFTNGLLMPPSAAA